jgi:hypothetical protein
MLLNRWPPDVAQALVPAGRDSELLRSWNLTLSQDAQLAQVNFAAALKFPHDLRSSEIHLGEAS